MDTVVFDGVEYVKASVAAKSFRYTSDYIGQLCRSKKIDARLVGRTWFVNLDSIKEHKQNKYKVTTDSKVDRSDITNKIKILPIKVHSVENTRAAKIITEEKINSNPSRNLRVSYNRDEESLLPKLIKKHVRPPKTVRIELANARKVNISDTKKNIASFQASELPDVALSGNLKVTTYSDTVEVEEPEKFIVEPEKTLKNIVISPKQDIKPVVETDKQTVDSTVENIENKTIPVINPISKVGENVPITDLKTQVVNENVQKVDTDLQSPFTPNLVQSAQNKKVSSLAMMSPLIATLIALLCVVIIFSASMSVVVFESVYESHIVFQMANLLDVLQR